MPVLLLYCMLYWYLALERELPRKKIWGPRMCSEPIRDGNMIELTVRLVSHSQLILLYHSLVACDVHRFRELGEAELVVIVPLLLQLHARASPVCSIGVIAKAQQQVHKRASPERKKCNPERDLSGRVEGFHTLRLQPTRIQTTTFKNIHHVFDEFLEEPY